MVPQKDCDTTSNDPLLDRRSFVGVAGASVAGLFGAGTLSGSAAADDRTLLEIGSPTRVTYQFTVRGDVDLKTSGSGYRANPTQERVLDRGDHTTVVGLTGNGSGDGFWIDGEITAFDQLAGDYTLYVDGEQKTVNEITGGYGPAADGDAIGGGDDYRHTFTAEDADTVVGDRSGLESALSSASEGDVVFLESSVDMGTSRITVPQGVTLASDRGVDGSEGAAIRTSQLHDNHYGMVRAEQDARISGLRVLGPMSPDGWNHHSYDHEVTGIYARANGVEIDNVEGSGWGYAAVYTADDTHVHHCELHHNNVEGLGYGVMTNNSAQPLVEFNEFYHNRHSVAASGTGGFTARYNLVRGPAISHVFDQHRPGGTRTKVYNNTIEVVDNDQKNKNVPTLAIRGVPDETADVYNNWIHNPKAPRSTPSDWTDEAVIQVHTSSWRNVYFWDNHYGSDEPLVDVGCPR